MLAQEELAATALPSQVIHIVDVADKVRLFEAHHVPVFIGSHVSSPIINRASVPRTPAENVGTINEPAPRNTQPSARAQSNVSGVSIAAPAFFKHSDAAQTRVAAACWSSPASCAIKLASWNRS